MSGPVNLLVTSAVANQILIADKQALALSGTVTDSNGFSWQVLEGSTMASITPQLKSQVALVYTVCTTVYVCPYASYRTNTAMQEGIGSWLTYTIDHTFLS